MEHRRKLALTQLRATFVSDDAFADAILVALAPPRAAAVSQLPVSVLQRLSCFLPAPSVMALAVSSRALAASLLRCARLRRASAGIYVVGGTGSSSDDAADSRHPASSSLLLLPAAAAHLPHHSPSSAPPDPPVGGGWGVAAAMTSARYHAAAAVLNGLLYVAGGRDAQQRLALLEVYAPTPTPRWRRLAPLPRVRSAPAMVAFQGRLVVVGGFDGAREVRQCDVYDPPTDVWASGGLPPLAVAVCEAGACVLGGCVYVVGGAQRRFSQAEDVLAAVQKYDPKVGAWTLCAPLPTARMCPGVVAFRGRVWVIGGSDGRDSLASVEVYDPASDRWSSGPPLSAPRSNAAACVVGQGARAVVCVAGGFREGQLDSGECYSPTTGHWRPLPTMPTARDACKLVAIE